MVNCIPLILPGKEVQLTAQWFVGGLPSLWSVLI